VPLHLPPFLLPPLFFAWRLIACLTQLLLRRLLLARLSLLLCRRLRLARLRLLLRRLLFMARARPLCSLALLVLRQHLSFLRLPPLRILRQRALSSLERFLLARVSNARRLARCRLLSPCFQPPLPRRLSRRLPRLLRLPRRFRCRRRARSQSLLRLRATSLCCRRLSA
jgi:hypothetical protein